VEDEEMVRKLAARILQQCGYTVIEASSGPEAMKLISERDDRIDLMLTDVAMPNMNGRELATRMASMKPDMRVLFMSGPVGEIFSHHSGPEDGTMFVYKPFTPETLSQRIRQALET
jgi:two-component system cell cycle sensor histidine kinase/response regulator CckA